MAQSGYRTTLHIYFIFFISLCSAILLVVLLFFLLVLVQKPDGSFVRSDWPQRFTTEFAEQIIFVEEKPQIKQTGLELLQTEGIGLQILDISGQVQLGYQVPEPAKKRYSVIEQQQLMQTGQVEGYTVFGGTVADQDHHYTYMLYYPIEIAKVTMYLNGAQFVGGKRMILPMIAILFCVILLAGIVYGFQTTRAMDRLTLAIQDISRRRYVPEQAHGVFTDLYDSLYTLDAEIKASDQLRRETEKIREEWIANITHDLKTPLSPIKGYAEILWEQEKQSETQCRRYAGIMLKNAVYMETLLDDLKLTYQLDSKILPIKRTKQNIVRFLKEIVIDILNMPDYKARTIDFVCIEETIFYTFDAMLLTRALRNIMINAFIHGTSDTALRVVVTQVDTTLQICIVDNGVGLSSEAIQHLFDRYYRGTSTEQKPEGSGLGLAIAKRIIEQHEGTITVSSTLGEGTAFQINFLLS